MSNEIVMDNEQYRTHNIVCRKLGREDNVMYLFNGKSMSMREIKELELQEELDLEVPAE